MSSSAKDGKGGLGVEKRPSDGPESDDGEFRTVATAAPEFGDAPSPIGDRPKAQIDPPRLFPPPAPAYPRPMPKPSAGPVPSAPVRRSAVPLPSGAGRPAPAAAVPRVNESEEPDSSNQHTQLLDTTSSGQQKIIKQPPNAMKQTAQSRGAEPPPPPSAFRETAPSAGVLRPNRPATSSGVAAKVQPPAQSTGSVKVVPKDALPRLYEEEAGLDDAATQLADLGAPAAAEAAAVRPPMRSEAETLAVDRGDLMLRPKEIKVEEVATGRAAREDEETKAVPREELMRDPSMPVGKSTPPPAQERDRTLALPSPVEAGGGRVPNFAAFASTVVTENDPAYPGADPYLAPPPHDPYAHAQHAPAPMMPPQQSFGAAPGPTPHAPPPPHWGQQLPPTQLGAQPMASMQPQPSAFGGPAFGNAPSNAAPLKAPAKQGPMISTQMLLLVAVGVVCLAIFGIGIYLFVTTKF